MRTASRLLAGGLCAALASAGLACGSDDSGSGGGGEEKVSVAYVSPFVANAYQISYECGMVEAAKDDGSIDLSTSGSPEFSPDAQIPVIQAAAAKQPDVLITSATDADALAGPLREVKESGSEVIVYDTLLNDDSIPAFQIGSDNYGGGVQIAETLGEALDGKGKVLPIDLAPGVKSTNDRASGFIDTIKEKYPDIELLDTQFDELNPQKSASIVQATLSANPDLAAIVPMYNDGAIAALSALKSGSADDVAVYTFDADPRIVDALRDGQIEAVASQQPYLQAKETLEMMRQTLDDEEVDKETLTPMELVTADNVDDKKIQESAFYVDERCSA